MAGVKEQTATIYAKLLAKNGFVALTFDTAYQGESAGEPRGLEDPFQRAEDIKCAVTYLSTLNEVDPERIGALGICASGGYVPFAAQADLRIKAVATVSAVCAGEMIRHGLITGTVDQAMFLQQLKASQEARIAESKGGVPMAAVLPAGPDKVPESSPRIVKELVDYYKTPRGQHPRSTNIYATRSTDPLANYPSFAFNDMISPRPLLMITGTEAATRYFSEEGIKLAK